MIKTRDFLLFVIALLFLFMGIATTVAFDRISRGHVVTPTMLPLPPETVISAEVPASTLDRKARLASLRALLAEHESVLTVPAADALVSTEEEADEIAEANEPTATVAYCDSYPGTPLVWPSERLSIVEREGARLLVVQTPESSSSPETVVLQLPIGTTAPAQQSNCIQTDIVGVARDGLPIKNDEMALFSVFGAATLIGYALDGFPIYGTDPDVVTDQCGGLATADGYRYIVDPDRPGVLGCFTGTPIDLSVWLP